MGPQGTKLGSAFIDVTANTDKFRRGMADMDTQAKRSTASVRNEIEKTDAKIKGMTGSVGMLSQAMAAIGGVAAAGQLIKIADTFTQMRGRLSLVVKEGENLLDVEEKLYQLAIKNRAALEPTVALYARLRSARADLSDEQALKIVDTWNKTLVISGASAGGASAATIQLSQAMASGTLRAEEFNSIVENNTRAVQLFATSLGVTVGELRTLVNEGKVGFDELVKAMTEDAGSVGDEFGKMNMTVGQALTNLQTSMIRFVGLQDQQFEGSKKLAEWIAILAENFDVLARAILVAGASVASAIGGNMIFGMIASLRGLAAQMIATGSAAKALGLAMSWTGGPWGIALGAIAAAVGSIAFSFMDLRTPVEKADEAIAGVNASLQMTDQIIEQWKAVELQAKIDGIGKSAKEAAGDLDALNAAANAFAMREQRNAQINAANLDARIAQQAIQAYQTQLAFLNEEIWMNAGGDDFKQRRGGATEIKALEAKLYAAQNTMNAALQRAEDLGRMPIDFGLPPKPKPQKAAPTTTTKTITELAGEYTALETYERSLADIRKATAEGAVGGNRAILKSMRDYLDAGGSVRRVLADVKELSGSMLDPTTLAMIDDLILATQTLDAIDVPSEIDIAGGTKAPGAWDDFEQRIADATKFGLMNAIETGDWGEAFGQILTDVTRDALSNALDVLWEALSQIDWGGQGQGWGGFLNMVGSSLGGSFKPMAGGGPVRAGEMLRVGEMGSEWFMPKTDGFIVPHGGFSKSLESPTPIMVGAPVVNVYGNADSVTRTEIAETLGAFSRSLPTIIDQRVTDRQKRGAY